MRSTFKVLFYVKKGSEKPNGNLPLMCRITVDGTQAQFSCKVTANPKLWDTKGGRMTGKSAPCHLGYAERKTQAFLLNKDIHVG